MWADLVSPLFFSFPFLFPSSPLPPLLVPVFLETSPAVPSRAPAPFPSSFPPLRDEAPRLLFPFFFVRERGACEDGQRSQVGGSSLLFFLLFFSSGEKGRFFPLLFFPVARPPGALRRGAPAHRFFLPFLFVHPCAPFSSPGLFFFSSIPLPSRRILARGPPPFSSARSFSVRRSTARTREPISPFFFFFPFLFQRANFLVDAPPRAPGCVMRRSFSLH